MASYRLNIARIRGCPPPQELAGAMEEFGLPGSEEFGVLHVSITGKSAFGTIVRRTQQAVPRLDTEAREVTDTVIEKATVYPFGVRPDAEVLEVYAGSASSIEQVGLFFSSCLALPTVVEGIELDVPAAVDKLRKTTEKFQLHSVRVSDYAHSSFMSGPYAPRFLDTQHGRDFLEEYAEVVTSAGVRFLCPGGRAIVHLSPKAAFRFRCSDEDHPFVQSILRKLA